MNTKLYAIAGRICGYIGQLLIIAALPLILSPELFAKYNLAMPILMLGSSVVYGWLNGAAFRWAHKIITSKDHIIKSAIIIYYIILFFISMLISMAIFSFGLTYESLIPIAVFTVSIKDYFLKLSNACEDYVRFFLANVLYLIGKILFVAALYKTETKNFELILALFIVSELFFLPPFVKKSCNFVQIGQKQFEQTLKEMLRYGGPLIIASISIWVISLSDRYILSYYADKISVANYILVYQFSSNAITIPLIFFITIYFPALLKIERENGLVVALQYNRSILKKYYVLSPIYATAIGVSLYFSMKFFYHKYQADALLIAMVMSAQVILGASHFYNKKYELDNRTHLIAISVFISAAIDVICNLIMIPRLGSMGAAYSTIIANLSLLIVTSNINKLTRKNNAPVKSI